MNEAAVLEVGREALWVILKAAGPIMLSGLGIGLLIALFQALTTIQEMTLTFVPKIIVIFGAIIFFMPWMMQTVIEFTRQLFDRMVALG
ncbi:MAG: flagellar biosynthesis protein FliQ [Rhodospirillaceae bacterium]|jgi:flagellar biosynthetic protein FliQ|nr:flagellar biosynthesis protein FliQ [Rhodospirillaceae bacterium]MBT3910930.1 flagellar biosynthesis protein FliQ [Rhodospirillaceae bacterium]MBT5296957.1 flagellar biosynthesis protein FliQ [Rhodospirillaceae bacterium]MBT5513517.1 flagellar biosynthesis protein FliQ [Rhodospirillaceae bacterium]MBT6087874.1 flagellar biosynthesis protein FliQ [Rhodospirillaceae bacterium]